MDRNQQTSWYQIHNGTITLRLYIQPGAKRHELVGLHGEALKIKLAAPPLEGRANDALAVFIASLFKVPLRQVELKKGSKSRYKTVIIQGSQVHPEGILS